MDLFGKRLLNLWMSVFALHTIDSSKGEKCFINQPMKNLLKPDNSAEAEALQSLLQQHGIHSQVISYHDTAYDGLFQAQYGWGVLRVAESDFINAEKIVNEWKASTPGELPWDGEDS